MACASKTMIAKEGSCHARSRHLKRCNGKTITRAPKSSTFKPLVKSDMMFSALEQGNEDMTSSTDISVLYQEFTDALTEVLAENSVGPARRGRLARARAAVKRHPKYTEHEYFLAVETAFQKWEAIQNVGR